MTEVARHRSPDLAADFRGFMSTFCTGVAIVTSFDTAGRAHGLTCTSLASVTLDPPTLLVCLNVSSGTLAALLQGGGFLVNLLHERGRAAAERFASGAADRFERVTWRPSPWDGQPWLYEDSFAAAGCEVAEVTAVGDHMAVFGRVTHVTGEPGIPLLYGMREFSGWWGGRNRPAASPTTG
jgi:flavin reductase (NADH)